MPTESPRPTVLFMYLGRLGALGRFTYELMEAAEAAGGVNTRFLVSSNNESAGVLKSRFPHVLTLETFDRPTPQALALGYWRARKQFTGLLDQIEPAAVVNLMPHVWSPLLAPTVRRRGARFVPVIHDAVPHPGDRTARLTRWLLRDAKKANRIVALSEAVARSPRVTRLCAAPAHRDAVSSRPAIWQPGQGADA